MAYYGEEGESLACLEDVESKFNFQLTPAQESLSKEIYEASTQGNVCIHAVCGAGKTELIVYSLAQYLAQGKKVGLVIARRQVVLELSQRFKSIFPHLMVTPVCEGYTNQLKGHLIISTSHQLFRFYQHFDVLFVDEPDAFPFSSDFVLQGFAKQAVIGHTVYMSATPNDWVIKNVAMTLSLNRRPHGFDLPVPRLIKRPILGQILYTLSYLHQQVKPVLIFVPTKSLGKKLSMLMKIPFVYARAPNMDQDLKAFRDQAIKTLLCTTVLERGLTFYGVQVLVLEAQHPVFTQSSLIQIAGRVGRDPKDPYGEVVFLCSKKTHVIKQSIQEIQSANIV